MNNFCRRLEDRYTLSALCLVLVVSTACIWTFGGGRFQYTNFKSASTAKAAPRSTTSTKLLSLEDGHAPPNERSTESVLSRNEIRERISSLSPFHGFHNKTGMIHPYRWLPDFREEADSAFAKWENDVGSNMGAEDDHPKPFPECWVHVNHHYRYIWVKIPKSGGTALKKQLAYGCNAPDHPTAHGKSAFCSQRAWYTPDMRLEDAKTWWRDYFVFSVVRNPYSRFASSFGFINKSMQKCELAKFNEVCRDPFLQAKTCIRDGCCKMQHHHVHHMAEQSSCLFSEEGGMAVDFVGQTETLNSDFEIIATEINKRRKEGVPAIQLEDQVNEANVNANYTDGYTGIYADNPGCLESVRRLFGEDIESLQYER